MSNQNPRWTQKTYTPLCLNNKFGPDYYDTGSKYECIRVLVTGGAYVIGNQNPRWTQKPRIAPMFTHHIWF